MINTVELNKSVNLKEMIERDTEVSDKKRLWCPFCQGGQSSGNNSPALLVDDNRYYCFGCGATGDAIDYVMKRRNVDFLRACTMLGYKNGTSLQDLEKSQAEWKIKQAQDKTQRAIKLDSILAEYTADEIWEAYHRKMNSSHVSWWDSQGVPADWQDYLRLGYTPDKPYRDGAGELHHSPAYTIPYFHSGFIFKNLQYRLQDPTNPRDRYRFEYGLKTVYYMVEPDRQIEDKVIICEGAKKAMVCKIWSNQDKTSILAVPSKVDFGSIAEALTDVGRVWIILDPDAWEVPANASAKWLPPPVRLAKEIGDKARIIELPQKLDDLILAVHPDKTWMESLMRTARRVK